MRAITIDTGPRLSWHDGLSDDFWIGLEVGHGAWSGSAQIDWVRGADLQTVAHTGSHGLHKAVCARCLRSVVLLSQRPVCLVRQGLTLVVQRLRVCDSGGCALDKVHHIVKGRSKVELIGLLLNVTNVWRTNAVL